MHLGTQVPERKPVAPRKKQPPVACGPDATSTAADPEGTSAAASDGKEGRASTHTFSSSDEDAAVPLSTLAHVMERHPSCSAESQPVPSHTTSHHPVQSHPSLNERQPRLSSGHSVKEQEGEVELMGEEQEQERRALGQKEEQEGVVGKMEEEEEARGGALARKQAARAEVARAVAAREEAVSLEVRKAEGSCAEGAKLERLRAVLAFATGHAEAARLASMKAVLALKAAHEHTKYHHEEATKAEAASVAATRAEDAARAEMTAWTEVVVGIDVTEYDEVIVRLRREEWRWADIAKHLGLPGGAGERLRRRHRELKGDACNTAAGKRTEIPSTPAVPEVLIPARSRGVGGWGGRQAPRPVGAPTDAARFSSTSGSQVGSNRECDLCGRKNRSSSSAPDVCGEGGSHPSSGCDVRREPRHLNSARNGRPQCRFWVAGTCTRGQNCNYSHAPIRHKSLPLARCSPLSSQQALARPLQGGGDASRTGATRNRDTDTTRRSHVAKQARGRGTTANRGASHSRSCSRSRKSSSRSRSRSGSRTGRRNGCRSY